MACSTPRLSTGEKRILMKFLIQSVREEDKAVDHDKTFVSYLKQQMFMFCLAWLKTFCPAFLWSIYGTESYFRIYYIILLEREAFCWLCAVLGVSRRVIRCSNLVVGAASTSRGLNPSCHGSGQPPESGEPRHTSEFKGSFSGQVWIIILQHTVHVMRDKDVNFRGVNDY